MAVPNPIKVDPFGKTPDQIVEERNTNCIHYGGCLDQAFSKNWKGFSCRSCEIIESEDLFEAALSKSHRDHEADNIYLQF